MRIFLAILLSAVVARAADVMDAAHKINWARDTGVPGGIPVVTDVHATHAAGTSTSTIQSSLDSCPSNKCVVIQAGNTTLSARLLIDNDGVVLRGETNQYGIPTTRLASSSGADGVVEISNANYPTAGSNVRDINSGYTEGSQSIVLASAPTGLVVGDLGIVDQANSGDRGTHDEGSQWGRDNGSTRQMLQVVRVTAINSATVSFEPPLYETYIAADSPQFYWWARGVVRAGVENIMIDHTAGFASSDHNVFIQGDACWMKNVTCTNIPEAGIRSAFSLNVEIRDCIFRQHDSVASASYSIFINNSSGARIENNAFENIPCAIGLLGGQGSYVGYNFTTNTPYTDIDWLPQVMFTHGGHPHKILWEGNWTTDFSPDNTHGTSTNQSFIRNRSLGYDGTDQDEQMRPFALGNRNDNILVAGNIFGWDGWHSSYETTDHVKIWGVNAGCENFVRLGNYNTVNDAVPAGESLGGSTVSNSYVYVEASARPEHWGSRWPAFEATDFSGSNNETNIPAGFRFRDANFAWPAAAAQGGGGDPPSGGNPGQPPASGRAKSRGGRSVILQ